MTATNQTPSPGIPPENKSRQPHPRREPPGWIKRLDSNIRRVSLALNRRINRLPASCRSMVLLVLFLVSAGVGTYMISISRGAPVYPAAGMHTLRLVPMLPELSKALKARPAAEDPLADSLKSRQGTVQ